ncbi:MAG: 2-oxoacid:acceptor oxidoreductase family protein [Candidatus Komeilibacteria bacterium]
MVKEINKTLNICLAGEGGQGVQTIAKVLVNTAFKKDLEATYVPNYGVEQRGGVSIAFVRLASKHISYPKFETADIVVLLSDRSYDRVKSHIGKQTKVIYNKDFINQRLPFKFKGYAFDKLANELGEHRTFNMFILGKVVKMLDTFELEDIIATTHEKFVAKYEKLVGLKDFNEKAIRAGFNLK